MDKFGYHGQVLHVDLTARAFKAESMPPPWYRAYASGALMGEYFLLRDTRKGIGAFSKENRLVFASGVLAGYGAPALAQFSVSARSPISGNIASAQCEGEFGRFIKASGYDAIVIYGKAKTPVGLLIEDGVPQFVEAGWIWGNSALESANLFARAYGVRREAVVSVGQAGENRVRFASIVSGSGNQAAGTGVGAVMGSKGLKSLMLRGGSRPKAYDPERLADINAAFSGAALERRLFASPAATEASGSRSILERILDQYRNENPCPCCPFGCVHHIGSKEAPLAATSVNRWRAKSLAREPNPDIWLHANALCNSYGLDPVAARLTLLFAFECAEAGLIASGVEGIPMGDYASVLPLITLIAERRDIGELFSGGALSAAKRIGGEAIAIARRIIKEGEPLAAPVREDTAFALNALGLCPYASQSRDLGPDFVRDVLFAVTGWEAGADDFVRWHRRRERMNALFKLREG